MGTTFFGTEVPVIDVIREGLAVDVTLLLGGMLVAAAWAVPAGILCAVRPRSWAARALQLLAVVLVSSPVYWLGFVVMISFANGSGYIAELPFVSGQGDYHQLSGNPLEWGRALWVPLLLVGAPLGAQILRMTAASVRDVRGEEFIRTARAKGLSEGRVMSHHALPVAATPLAMLTGVNVNLMVTNVVLLEAGFNLPGTFRYLEDAIATRDVAFLQGLVLVWTVMIVVANFASDTFLAWLDPRVRA
jgi:peptide/nickel transport system permease protein